MVWKALNLGGQLPADSRIITVSFPADGECWGRAKGNTEEKLACQDSAAAPAGSPADPSGRVKPRLSAEVRAEPCFYVPRQSTCSWPLASHQTERRIRTFLPKLTAVRSGCASRLSWKSFLIAAGEKWKCGRFFFSFSQFSEVKVLLKLIYSRIVPFKCQSGCELAFLFLFVQISSLTGVSFRNQNKTAVSQLKINFGWVYEIKFIFRGLKCKKM